MYIGRMYIALTAMLIIYQCVVSKKARCFNWLATHTASFGEEAERNVATGRSGPNTIFRVLFQNRGSSSPGRADIVTRQVAW